MRLFTLRSQLISRFELGQVWQRPFIFGASPAGDPGQVHQSSFPLSSRQAPDLGAVGRPLEPNPRADLYLPLRERRVGDGPGRLAIVDIIVG